MAHAGSPEPGRRSRSLCAPGPRKPRRGAAGLRHGCRPRPGGPQRAAAPALCPGGPRRPGHQPLVHVQVRRWCVHTGAHALAHARRDSAPLLLPAAAPPAALALGRPSGPGTPLLLAVGVPCTDGNHSSGLARLNSSSGGIALYGALPRGAGLPPAQLSTMLSSLPDARFGWQLLMGDVTGDGVQVRSMMRRGGGVTVCRCVAARPV